MPAAVQGADTAGIVLPKAGAVGVLRLTRFAAVLVLGVIVLLLPHLAWRIVRPAVPSPFARLYLRMACAGAGLRVAGRGEPFARRTLIVANHVGWSDILVLGGSAQATFVAKAEVRGWPGIGILARLAPTLFVRRGARSEARAQCDVVAAALRRGSVMLFPEGTTGSGAEVLPFRSTLFATAGVVQPVAIAYDPPPGVRWSEADRAAFAWDGDKPFLPHLIAVIAAGGACCTVTALPPIRGADRKALARAAREAIVGALAR